MVQMNQDKIMYGCIHFTQITWPLDDSLFVKLKSDSWIGVVRFFCAIFAMINFKETTDLMKSLQFWAGQYLGFGQQDSKLSSLP